MQLKVKEKIVLLEKVGWVKTSEQIPIGVKYKNPRVTYDGKYWYISVTIDQKLSKEKLTDEIIGIDLGIKELAICSNGAIYKNINKTHKVKKIEKRLHMLQRKVSRKYQMNKEGEKFIKTNNIVKLEKQIRILYRKITGIRKNHIFQSVNDIVKTKPSIIVMEDLNIINMIKNKHLAKIVLQQKLYEFKRVVQYKCEWLGIKFIEVGRYYPSSKLCSCCGFKKVDLKLSDRIYKCDNCGHEMDRDLNAAVNLANFASICSH